MTRYFVAHAFVALVYVASCVCADSSGCEVRARTDAGWVCGRRRRAENIFEYASFRGIPYAKQPLGELRFKELEPVEPWDGCYDAASEGPICPQKVLFYGPLLQYKSMSESCIHANVHVPINALPVVDERTFEIERRGRGLPILVFIHGGGFAYGSGNADVYGPEYLITKDVIVITFNYRLNVFGFLSLNSSSIPGNAGLRDMVTLLRWVRRNAHNFGGDPDNVTLGGQSAGAGAAHMLTLSKAAQGLFKRAIMMSGSSIRPYYTTSPAFAKVIADEFLSLLGINSTDTDYIHRQLIDTPLEIIMEAHNVLLDKYAITTFLPTVEIPFPGVTTILDDRPENLLKKGRGKDISLIIGFTDAECQNFRPRFEEVNIMARIKANSSVILNPTILYTLSSEEVPVIAEKIEDKYFAGSPSLDKYIECCSDSSFIYSALKTAQCKAAQGGEPAYLYQFSYEAEFSVFKETFGLNYKGAGHADDLTFIFRVNSALGSYISFPPMNKDDEMKDRMTTLISNFMRSGNPTYGGVLGWPSERHYKDLQYEDIRYPRVYRFSNLTEDQENMKNFFDNIFKQN